MEIPFTGYLDTLSRVFAHSFRHIPTNLISRSWGRFARTNASKQLIGPFAKVFRIATNEAEKDIEEYANLNDFFTRRLKPGARPIDENPHILVSPVDGAVSFSGQCIQNRLIQIKGIYFDLFGLLRDGPMSKHFEDGQYATLYLSPQDYHRVHAPLDMSITGIGYMPGTLLPVNRPSVRWVPDLYTQNERLMIYADTPCGPIALVLVGAQCVGYISLTFSDFITNRPGLGPARLNFASPINVNKGQELGAFEMGSTVVMLLTKDRAKFEFPESDLPVRVGQRIGSFLDPVSAESDQNSGGKK